MYKFLSIFVLVLALEAIASPVSKSGHDDDDPMLAGYFEGDMRFRGGFQQGRNGIIGDQYRWPDNTIPIQVDESFTRSERNVIFEALKEISQKTCIKFVYHESQDSYVFIKRGAGYSGCWSYLGRQPDSSRGQVLNLETPGCINKAIVIHEIMHTTGFFHEQSREDRDDYITINWDNIQYKHKHNFQKYTGNVYGIPYDYDSLMHYGAYDFAIDKKIPTIITPNGEAIGQRNGMSELDALKVRKMYHC